ncbi:ethanolamine utilization protein [Ilyonectria robusta]|uniref:ethanolamine utilization protein n=1 Tax=Ilyonectria robusta TaxID=1079257 RepID=UPI001E8CC962|nr:ethanolamine utilization protein [Ilyonectria robusta]KAH8667752.1 ethanolamine utilization protein [Ilyonectria robusta]
MVFEWKDEGKLHRVPKLEPGPPNVYFGDMFCTPDKDAPNPLTGSFFLLEKIDTLEPAPKYDYDESGVVLKGELHIEDEAGNTAKLLPGDTFFVHRGSTITFSTPRYAVAYKVAARHGHLKL